MAANEQRPSPPPAPPSGERRGTRLSHSNRRVGKESVASARSIQATRARPPRPVRVASPPAPATLSSPSPALGPCACRVSLAAARDAPTSAFAARACTSRRLAPRDRHLNKTHLARKISFALSFTQTYSGPYSTQPAGSSTRSRVFGIIRRDPETVPVPQTTTRIPARIHTGNEPQSS